jgi:hypothetical protein
MTAPNGLRSASRETVSRVHMNLTGTLQRAGRLQHFSAIRSEGLLRTFPSLDLLACRFEQTVFLERNYVLALTY